MVEHLAQMSSVIFPLFMLLPLLFSDYPESTRVLLHVEESSLDIQNHPEIPAHTVSLIFTLAHKIHPQSGANSANYLALSIEAVSLLNAPGVKYSRREGEK